MPQKNYMVVDPRRDHSFRVPRPDLSAKLGTPNACTGCHQGKTASWAAGKVRGWYGHDAQGHQNYAQTLHAARTNSADAQERLLALVGDHNQPAIARATAVSELGHRLTPQSFPAVSEALGDADPLVRAAALEALNPVPPPQRWQTAHQLLRDPVRVVRALAGDALVGIPAGQIPSKEQAGHQKASEEYLAAQQLNADVPGSQVNIGNFHAARGDAALAEQAYREALALDPNWLPATVNLSDFYRQTGRDAEGEAVLREGLARQPKAASLHHSLGLLLVRQKNLPQALASLKQAVELEPGDTRFRYVYAVALHSAGRAREARAVVELGLKRAPSDPGLNELKAQLAGSPQ
jgi:tetratricopeptide (TPR) repeat protein